MPLPEKSWTRTINDRIIRHKLDKWLLKISYKTCTKTQKREYQSNQHVIFYSFKPMTKEQETNLSLHLRVFYTTKIRSLPFTIHHQKKSNQLSRRKLHTNGWSHHSQDPSQHGNFHKQCLFHLYWFIKLLSHHPPQQKMWLWIFLNTWVGHPWRHHEGI